MKKDIKTLAAKSIVFVAYEVALRTVGKSIPVGFHEVDVPKELKGTKLNGQSD